MPPSSGFSNHMNSACSRQRVERHAGKGGLVARFQRLGGAVEIGEGGRLAHVIHDPLDADGGDLGADIVEHHAVQPVGMGVGEGHGNQPAARGPDDGGLVEPEVIEQFDRILPFAQDVVGHVILGIVGLPAPAIIEPYQAGPGHVRHEVGEIGGVAGEPGKAEDGRALALILVEERQAVGGGEAWASGGNLRYAGEVFHHRLWPGGQAVDGLRPRG